MRQKLFLFPVLLVLSFIGGWLYTQYASKDSSLYTQSVKGLSESAIYIPNNYIDVGVPEDIVVLPDNTMWFVDSQNYKIIRVNASGEILRTVGKQGTNIGEFESTVTSITADNDGNLYVLDYCKVYKLDSNGGYITSWGACGAGESEFSSAKGIHYNEVVDAIFVSDTLHHRILRFTKDGTYVSQFGSEGSADGQFDEPQGIYSDAEGRIYVADEFNYRIQRFSAAGGFDISFGEEGVGDGQFEAPKDIAVAANGDIYVSSQNSQKIQIFEEDGDWKSSWGESGSSAWQFLAPKGIGFDSSENLWVTDGYNRSLQRFSKTGTFMSGIRNSGFIAGKFAFPHAVAYDSLGNLYTLDNGASNARIQKFTNSGSFVETVVNAPDIGISSYHMSIKDDKIYVTFASGFKVYDLDGTELISHDDGGTGDGQFDQARGIDADSAGNIYVADLLNSRVQKFDNTGTYVSQFGGSGSGDGQFGVAEALYIDESDNIYVSDNPSDAFPEQGRIQRFNTSGVFQQKFGAWGYEDNQLDRIVDITKDTDGNILLSDLNRHKIKVYDTDGTYLSSYGGEGSSVEKFFETGGLAINPLTDTVTIADTGNHRVQLLPAGTRIYNLNSSTDVTTEDMEISLVNSYINPAEVGADDIASRLYFGDYIVADFSVDMTSDRNWAAVGATTLVEQAVTLVTNLNPSDAPGISNTHSIYIVKQEGQTSVRVCPDAVTMEDITLDCANGYDLEESDPELETVDIDGITYWKVSGLTGTGVMSELVDVTPTPTPTATPTTTTTGTTTPTATATTTATPTVTTTTTATATPTANLPIGVTTLAPAPTISTQTACPVFESFTTSTTILQKGNKVKIQWQTKNTEAVLASHSDNALPPVGSIEIPLEQTTDLSFIADNGFCNAKKAVLVEVVDTLPWVTTLSLGTGALIAEAVFALQQPTLFGNIWLSLASFISRRKRQTWGVIYDSSTKKPLGRAVIRLHRADNTVVDTVVSEANGTYKLTPKVGSYTISVSLAGYTFPSTVILGDIDGGYSNIYKGTTVNITDTEQGILMSIPLDPANMSPEEKAKLQRKVMVTKVIEFFSNVLMIGGFGYSLYTAFAYPHLYNYLILALYFVLAFAKVLLLLPKKTSGTVKLEDGTPAVGVEIGLFDTEFKNLLYRTFTNEAGQYTFVVPNATYNLKVMDNRYKVLDQGVASSGIQIPELTSNEKVRVIHQDLSLLAG